MNANDVLMPDPSGALDFFALAKQSGYQMTELMEVAEILQTRLHRPSEPQEILVEIGARYSPQHRQSRSDFHDFFPEF